MTGGIVMAVLFIYERLWNKTVSTRIVIGGIIAFFIAAFFMAWRDQLHQTKQLDSQLADERKRSSPLLSGEVDMVATGDTLQPSNTTSITMIVNVRNEGAPSVVQRWRLEVPIGGKTIELIPTYFDTVLRLQTANGPISFSPKSVISEKTVTTPIPTGGLVRGVLLFVLKGYTQAQLRELQPQCKLKFEDVSRRDYAVPFRLQAHGESRLEYYSGVEEMPPSQR